jgi:predicted nucleic acid-binding protein
MTEELAQRVGILVSDSGHGDIVDVAVAEGAIRRGDGVVTSDAGHIRKIAEAAGSTLRIASI